MKEALIIIGTALIITTVSILSAYSIICVLNRIGIL